jgi:hypothetical protein
MQGAPDRFESSSPGPDPQEQGYGGQLHQHRERDDRTERDVVEITHKGAAEKPEYAVSRVEDPISRAALVGCHHIGNGRSHDGFPSPHADPPAVPARAKCSHGPSPLYPPFRPCKNICVTRGKVKAADYTVQSTRRSTSCTSSRSRTGMGRSARPSVCWW